MENVTFSAYITNLGKYNEGELIGEWVDFPISRQGFDQVLDRIGIDDEYEEWFVTDYECNLKGFDWSELGEYTSYEELEEFGELVDSIDDVESVDNAYEITGNLEEAMTGLENGDIQFYPGVSTDSDLGYYFVEEFGGVEQLDRNTIESYFDYEKLGRDLGFDEYETENEDGEEEYVSAGEYWCGDEDASDTEIGEAFVENVGFDGVGNAGDYFNYESYGRDIRFESGGGFTSDGFVMRY